MSSSGQIAVAIPWRSSPHPQPANSDGNPLFHFWDGMLQGRTRVRYETTTYNSIRLVANVDRAHDPISPFDAAIVLRVLCGDPQKVIASDLGIANSTVSGRCVSAFIKLGLGQKSVALPVVLAAQSSAGVVHLSNATSARFAHESGHCLAVSVPRPKASYLGGLTRAEQEVAQALMEGCTRSEIALRRVTSIFTVTRQFSAIFSALRVTGRYSLIRCAAERGCFS